MVQSASTRDAVCRRTIDQLRARKERYHTVGDKSSSVPRTPRGCRQQGASGTRLAQPLSALSQRPPPAAGSRASHQGPPTCHRPAADRWLTGRREAAARGACSRRNASRMNAGAGLACIGLACHE